MKVLSINVSKNLVEPVKKYQETRRYETFTRAANELIRIGLEKEEKKNEGVNTD